MKNKILMPAIIVLSSVAALALLFFLAKIEHDRELYAKYGVLIENAETDERAAYIYANAEAYPEEVLKKYYTGAEDDVDFVYNYFEHKDDYKNMSYTEEELNSETVPEFYMADHRWAYERFNNVYIQSSGCGPVSITMAYVYLTGRSDVDPVKVGQMLVDMGATGPFGGTDNARIDEACTLLGLTATEHDYTDGDGVQKTKTVQLDELRAMLEDGKVVIAAMSGETFGYHAVVIHSCDENGKIRLNDPAVPEKTAKEWNFEEIEPSIKYLIELSYE